MVGFVIVAAGILTLLFAIYCCNQMENNKNEDGFNIINSSLGVQCNANEKCDYRFTTMCNNCKHNCGMKQDKNCYEPK
jgi:hypothetical protein